MKETNVTIVIPVYNEEKNIQKLYRELINALKDVKSYEIIFVDDGSKDSSFDIIKKITVKDKKVRVIKLISNYGQSNAIAAGISNSQGKIIITMDSDLQHDPRDIIPMIRKIKEGYHVVCGWREYRNSSDSLIKKIIPSKISNFLIRVVTGIKLRDTTGGMRAFSRKVVETIPFYGEMHRYLPVLAYWKGFKITEVPIRIRERMCGETKYNYKRILRGFLDLITIKLFMKYSTRPTRIFSIIGILSIIVGFLIGSFYVYQKIVYKIHLLEEVASLILAVVLILLGFMFLGFGFIADMINFDAITGRKRETYIIDATIGLKNH